MQVLGDLAAPDLERAEAEQPTTLRLNLLAAEAYRQNLLSEGQLAQPLAARPDRAARNSERLEAEGSEARWGRRTRLTDPAALVGDTSTVII